MVAALQLSATVSTVATGCSRFWILQVCFDDIKMLLINVYLLYGDGNARTHEITS